MRLPDTTWELIVVMATLPCCRPPEGTTIPDGLTELETEVMDGEEVWISSWGSHRKMLVSEREKKLAEAVSESVASANWGVLLTDLLHVEAGVGRGVGSAQVVPQQVVAVHLGLEAGDITVAEVFTELIDLLQFQQVDP